VKLEEFWGLTGIWRMHWKWCNCVTEPTESRFVEPHVSKPAKRGPTRPRHSSSPESLYLESFAIIYSHPEGKPAAISDHRCNHELSRAASRHCRQRFISRIRRNPVVASLILAGSIIIALAAFTDAVKNIFSLFNRQSPAAARLELSKLSLDYTPKDFIASAKKGDAYPIRLFLFAGMDPNSKDDEGNTPLMYAASSGHEEAVRALLEAKAGVNERDGEGQTALSWAAVQKPEFVKLLLDAGADLDARDRAFVEAASHANPQIFRILIKAGISSNQVKSKALLEASGTNVVVDEQELGDTAKSLLDLGADVNARSARGHTPLFLAADAGHLVLARVLVDSGADINAGCDCPTEEDHPGWTPLMVAIWNAHTDVADFLLAKNAQVNRTNSIGGTALMIAASKSDANMVRKLLEKGADVNAANHDNRTALMAAVDGGSLGAAEAFVERGAIVNTQDNEGWTPLMVAALNLSPDHDKPRSRGEC
jgi:ankyrin repeat protein